MIGQRVGGCMRLVEIPGTHRSKRGWSRDKLFSQPQSSSLEPEIVGPAVKKSYCCHDDAVHNGKSGFSPRLKIKLFVRRLILIEPLNA